jgi:ribonuclease VapC
MEAVTASPADGLMNYCAAEIEIAEVTSNHAQIAREAYRDFGKNSGHRAGPELGRLFRLRVGQDIGRTVAV